MDTNDDRGWVKPVVGDVETAHMDPIEPIRASNRPSLIGGLILAVLIVTAVAATVVWRGRSGDPFGSARSIPATMDYVVTFDALALSDSERLQALVDAFAIPMVDAELLDDYPDDLVVAIDDAMKDGIGFTLTDDVLPWIGRSVSVAGTVPELSDPRGYDIEFSFIVSADVRDQTAAEAFVDKVILKLGDDDVGVTATEIAGQAGYRFGETGDTPAIALVLTGDALLVGVEDDVVSAIEAKDAGLSIVDDAGFMDTMSRLPAERMMSLYVAPRALNALVELGATATAGGVSGAPGSLDVGSAAAVSLVDEGLLFSYVVFGGEETAGALVPDSSVLASLPADTLGFVSIAGSASFEDPTFDESMFADMGYPLDQLSDELGIDIVSLIESLSGDLTLAATQTRNSSIADATDVPVGVVGVLGLTDSGPVEELVEMLEVTVEQQGFELDRNGGVTTAAVDGEELLSYSIQDDLLVVGTGRHLVEDVAAGGAGGFLNSDLYQELDQVVAGDGLVMFIDVGAIVDLVPLTSDEAAALSPLRGVGFGGEIDGDTVLMEVLLLIDY